MGVRSISRVFVNHLLLLFAEMILVGVLGIFLFLAGMRYGLFLPVNYATEVLEQNSEWLSGGVPFEEKYLPKFTTYALYDGAGNLQATTMTARQQEIYEKGIYGSKYYMMRVIERPDGTLVVIRAKK